MHVCRVFFAPDVRKTKSQEANQSMMGKDSTLPKSEFLWIVFSWTKIAAKVALDTPFEESKYVFTVS